MTALSLLKKTDDSVETCQKVCNLKTYLSEKTTKYKNMLIKQNQIENHHLSFSLEMKMSENIYELSFF